MKNSNPACPFPQYFSTKKSKLIISLDSLSWLIIPAKFKRKNIWKYRLCFMIDLKKTSTKLATKETKFFLLCTFFSYKDINKTHTKVPTTYNIKCCMQKKNLWDDKYYSISMWKIMNFFIIFLLLKQKKTIYILDGILFFCFDKTALKKKKNKWFFFYMSSLPYLLLYILCLFTFCALEIKTKYDHTHNEKFA